MIKIILRLILMTAALYGGVMYLDGITLATEEYGFPVSFVTVLFVFAVIEIVIHPLLNLVILPLRLITFGIASIVLSVVLVYFVSLIIPLFSVTSIISAVLLGVMFGIIRSFTK